ncbi:MAG: hypothetical protein ACD_37C00140G0004 [uncultured bacterium]|nr:MAG: hypothetical protein ACD_37C00140G0004 [uncultured bacterium]
MEMAFTKNIINNIRLYLFLILFLFLFFAGIKYAFASEYVLPYPSSMPGSKFYFIHQIYEKAEAYWYFGDLARYHYNLKYSDKYLVESKTLFEYKQYLLANVALEKSNLYFRKTRESLAKASSNKKPVKEKEEILKNASLKHEEVLNQILQVVPEEFDWQPEKDKPTKIYIQKEIEESIRIRKL